MNSILSLGAMTLASLFFVAGCGNGGSTAGRNDDEALPPSYDLDACTQGQSVSEVDAHLEIVTDFRDSLRELVICGKLNYAASIALIEILVDYAQSGSIGEPQGLTYEGDGIYRATSQGFTDVDMSVQFRSDRDYSFASAGEPIQQNLYSMSSYLKGAKASISSSGKLRISFDEPGPLAPLLDSGETPQSPLELSLSDLEAISNRLASLTIDSYITVADEQGSSSFAFEVDPPAMTVGDVAGGRDVRQDLVVISGQSELQQTLVVNNWSVNFTEGKSLSGEVDLTVTGGAFDFVGTFSYVASPDPSISVSCR